MSGLMAPTRKSTNASPAPDDGLCERRSEVKDLPGELDARLTLIDVRFDSQKPKSDRRRLGAPRSPERGPRVLGPYIGGGNVLLPRIAKSASVAVVVPTWNSVGLLPDCFGALREQGPGLELLVVDNGSSDGSLGYLERNGVPHLALPHNVGFARAMNLGVAQVKAEMVLALNADTVVEPGAVRALVDALEADPSLGGVQPRILQLDGGEGSRDIARARLYSAGQALRKDGRAVELGAGEEQSPRYLQRREVFGVCGAACLVRRELFDDLGGYDERYFSFYEDVDLNVRARIAGWRFEYVPEAVVWHLGNASWSAEAPQPDAWNARLVARNRIATWAKFMPARALPRVLAVEAGSLLRAARQKRLRATLRGKLEGLRLLSAMLRDRRRLRSEGDPSRATAWLGAASAGPAPRGG